MPDRDLSNVDVKFENGHLHLTAREEKSASSNAAAGTMQSVERGRYEEMIAAGRSRTEIARVQALSLFSQRHNDVDSMKKSNNERLVPQMII